MSFQKNKDETDSDTLHVLTGAYYVKMCRPKNIPKCQRAEQTPDALSRSQGQNVDANEDQETTRPPVIENEGTLHAFPSSCKNGTVPVNVDFQKQQKDKQGNQQQNYNAEIDLKIKALRKEINQVCKKLGIPDSRRTFRHQNATLANGISENVISKHSCEQNDHHKRNKTDTKLSKWTKSVRRSLQERKRTRKKLHGDDHGRRNSAKYLKKNKSLSVTFDIDIFQNKWMYKWKIKPTNTHLTLYPVHRNHTTDSLDSLFQSMGSGETVSADHGMNFEWMRLKSFASTNCELNLSPIVLSRVGFFYTGRGKEVKCYSCGTVYSEWSPQDDPLQVHSRISPQCRHIAGIDDRNVPIGHRVASSAASNTAPGTEQSSSTPTSTQNNNIRRNEVHFQQVQRNGQMATTSLPPTTHTVNRYEERSNSGLRQEDRFPTVSNQTSATENRPSHSQMTAPHSMQGRVGQQQVNHQGVSSATINKLSPLGVNFDKPRYPQYAVLTVRMSTYNGWPATQIPRKMAEAGFIYAGYADYARCFFCGGGLRNWEEGDDPWIEHARWFPRCAYVRQNKGDHFVQLVHERLQEMLRYEACAESHSHHQEVQVQENCQQTNASETKRNENVNETTDFKALPTFQSVLELGYSADMIEKIIKYFMGQGKKDITSSDILQILFKIEEGDNSIMLELETNTDDKENEEVGLNHMHDNEAKTLIEENRRLKEMKLCMICMERDSCIAFLPCGHLVCCEDCAPAMRKCPKCHQIVQGSIKTWLV